MKDISIYESGDGGEILILDSDINFADSLLQLVYLSLFGGNVESVTLGNEEKGEFRNDWWANSLLFEKEEAKQMNSLTEKTLKESPLSSSGRIRIQRAVEEDLKFLKSTVDITVDVLIKNSNRVEIYVKLDKFKDKQNFRFQFVWDNVQKSVIINKDL